MADPEEQRLLEAARKALPNAHPPFSGFRVACAVTPAGSDQIFTGVNLESHSYGATLCAERVALGAMVTAGHTALDTLLLLTGGDSPAPPCGICRQHIVELGPEATVISRTTSGGRSAWTTPELVPDPFLLDDR